MGPVEIRVRASALVDINEAGEFYAQKDDNGRLAARFMREVDNTILKISMNPKAYPRVYRSYRRAVLNRFPFGVFYLIHEEVVDVVAVFHGKRATGNLLLWRLEEN